MNRAELGDECKCKITGFKGIATSIAKCLTGCDRVALRGALQKDGKLGEEYWFDVDAVLVLKKGKVKPKDVQGTVKVGGPITRSNLK